MPFPFIGIATTAARAAPTLGQAAGGVRGALEGAVGTVGDILGLGKQPTESGCQLVKPEDVEGFLAGRIAPWIVGERQRDIGDAWGVSVGSEHPPTAEQLGLTFRQVAELHLREFIPICERISAGKRYKSSNDPEALADRARAREEFRRIMYERGPKFVGPKQSEGDAGKPLGIPTWVWGIAGSLLVGVILKK